VSKSLQITINGDQTHDRIRVVHCKGENYEIMFWRTVGLYGPCRGISQILVLQFSKTQNKYRFVPVVSVARGLNL